MGDQLKPKKKNKITYTKDKIIKNIAKELNEDVDIVRNIYNSLEENIAKMLSSATADTDVSVRLFEGISIDGVFVPEHLKTNNLTGENIVAKEKIKPKANITRYYRDKVTNYNK